MKPFRLASVALLAGLASGVFLQLAYADASDAVRSGLSWRLVGPFRGGWATVVTGVPDRPDTFYFGSAGGGVWRTENAGRTWVSVFDHGGAASIGALAVSPSNPKIIYVGTGQAETRYDLAGGSGVFKSVDGGASWKPIGFADTRHIGKIWIDPKKPDLVLVAVQGHFYGPSNARGVYRSTDGGNTWSQVLKTDNVWTGATDIASDPSDAHILFAATWEAHQFPWLSYFTPSAGKGSGIYKSTDEGATWTRLSGGGLPGGSLGRIGLAAAHAAIGTRVYASIDSDDAGGLYRSDDAGAHWTRASEDNPVASSYFSRLIAAPNDPDTVFTVGQSIRRCSKGGTACDIVKGAPGGDDYHHIWINPLHPDHVITGSDQGAVVSIDDWRSWSSWYNQPTGQFYHLATDNRFPYWIYSGQQDSGTVAIASRSNYGAITWRDWHPTGGDERDYDVPDPRDPDIVYDSGLGGHVSRWDGKTGQVEDVSFWPVSSYGKRPTLVPYHYLWATPLVASRTGPFALYLGAQVLFRSTDGGQHWSALGGDLTGKIADARNCSSDTPSLTDAKSCGYGSVSAIAPSPRAAGEIWVGADDGLIQLTRDSGAHWANITPPSMALWAKVSSIDVSPLAAGTAYAAADMHRLDNFEPHIFATHDYGHTWRDIAGNLPRDHFVDVVRADPVKAGLLYAGTDAGAYVSFDEGGHWSSLGQNLPTAWVTDLLVHGDDLIAATQGRAIWSLDDVAPLRETAAGSGAAQLFRPATAFRVHANNNADTPLPPETPQSPNPPAGAYIDYWLASNAPVTLEIHDTAGVLVRHFSSADKAETPNAKRYFAESWLGPARTLPGTAGFHRFVWNLRYARPPAARFGYTIAAVAGAGTPIVPQGAFVLPGTYQIVLEANGQRLAAPLTVREDPRVKTSLADLKASLVLSQKIAGMLARTHEGYAETTAVKKQIESEIPKNAPKDSISPLAAPFRSKPVPGRPTFETLDGTLTGIEGDLESADAAPTPAENAVVADALGKLANVEQTWNRLKGAPLAALNAALARAHKKPIVVAVPASLNVAPEEENEEIP